MQIYLVEDSATVRERLIAMLGAIPNAHIVGHAATAPDAIAGILDTQPDLVVLDMHLAEGSGFDVLRAVQPQAPGIEFHMLSNFAADPYRQLAARLGAAGFYDKSKQFNLVCDAVARRAALQTKGEPQ